MLGDLGFSTFQLYSNNIYIYIYISLAIKKDLSENNTPRWIPFLNHIFTIARSPIGEGGYGANVSNIPDMGEMVGPPLNHVSQLKTRSLPLPSTVCTFTCVSLPIWNYDLHVRGSLERQEVKETKSLLNA